MEAFINGIGCISPAGSMKAMWDEDYIIQSDINFLKSYEPNYKEYLNPLSLRRMSRIMKMGNTSAIMSIRDASIEKPDSVICGTGLGCMQDTSKFLYNMILNDEQQLNPTPFIQSTHNTIAGLIATITACNGYNITYAHRGFSFESALLDSLMQIVEGNEGNILVGGIDEITEDYLTITRRLAYWRNQESRKLQIKAGEGSVFFILRNKPSERAYAKVSLVSMKYKPKDFNEIEEWIIKELDTLGIGMNNIDLILSGQNNNIRFGIASNDIEQNIFRDKPIIDFKQYCGEYNTASAFALCIAAGIVSKQKLPFNLLGKFDFSKSSINNILIYNNFIHNHSLMLVSKC